ncbi:MULTISPECIES: hypothetical protein [unclassified Roseateles]|jgi:hypothetical protein|uniref:hypothetical protein n=1 Tax=unclassified Roseateles TaxID=2626991 RepID=UPI0006F24830|nr:MULTISPECIES: hypothetical protein [unclassified Roseateles]KQW51099.1 hypothetical protein ASC81_00070 [Pelomonas sp. Root405]KRA77331.1 hypothetical protein ASD88_00070 [Pelomonas sp. Root662]
MNPWIGVGLALAALVLGGALLGWQGVIFAMTGIVFWLLLQMSRLMRVMKVAGAAPMGSVGNAVMLNSKLHVGMKLVDLIRLAGSLGVKQAPETFVWRDPGGDTVEVKLVKGKLAEWRLLRAGETAGSS